MTRTNDAEMRLFHTIINDELTRQQRTDLALLMHIFSVQDPSDESQQAAMWRFARGDFAKRFGAYLHPSEHDQTREA